MLIKDKKHFEQQVLNSNFLWVVEFYREGYATARTPARPASSVAAAFCASLPTTLMLMLCCHKCTGRLSRAHLYPPLSRSSDVATASC